MLKEQLYQFEKEVVESSDDDFEHLTTKALDNPKQSSPVPLTPEYTQQPDSPDLSALYPGKSLSLSSVNLNFIFLLRFVPLIINHIP